MKPEQDNKRNNKTNYKQPTFLSVINHVCKMGK